METMTIYLIEKNTITIGNNRIQLNSIFQIRTIIRKLNKGGINVHVVDFYQRIGQLFEHIVFKPSIVKINGYSLPFDNLKEAKKFVACYRAYKTDVRGGGTEYCAGSFFNYLNDFKVDTRLFTDEYIIHSLKL